MTIAEKFKTLIDHLERTIAEERDQHPEIVEKLEKILFDLGQDTKKGSYDKSLLITNDDGTCTCQMLRKMVGEFYIKHKDKYPDEMYKEFIRTWSMPNEKGVPAWFREKSKPRGAFHVPGRLATWASRPWNNKDKPQQKIAPKPDSQRIDIL